MSNAVDYQIANSESIEEDISNRIARLRLSRNITQSQLAKQAGISIPTVKRVEKGGGMSFDTFIRILSAFKIQQNLALLIPDQSISPLERVEKKGKERMRARPKKEPDDRVRFAWGDEEEK